MPVIGFLHFGSPDLFIFQATAFGQGLKETGYVEGQNVAIEYRWAEGRYDRLPSLAADLVSHKVELVAAFGPPCAKAAKNSTSTIPIVFTIGSDPVHDGLVPSLASPGGNVTGISMLAVQLVPKRLELLSELIPRLELWPARKPEQWLFRRHDPGRRACGACERDAPQHPKGQHRKRDRRGLLNARQSAYGRARHRRRSCCPAGARSWCMASSLAVRRRTSFASSLWPVVWQLGPGLKTVSHEARI